MVKKKGKKKNKKSGKKKGKKKDKKVPCPSSKTAQDFLPRSSQSETYVFHFPKKRNLSVFGVNGTSFLQDIQRKKRKKTFD